MTEPNPEFIPHRLTRLIGLATITTALISTTVFAEEMNSVEMTLPEINVSDTELEQQASENTGEYKINSSRLATRLNLSVKETPQALSVITRQQMDDFSLNTVNDVLEMTPGINVEKVETDRTYYTARGFDVTNFQVDGIGVPMHYGNIAGEIDTVAYDRVEVLRGATGLMTGTGNPSATVNFVRKRPTSDFQASLKGLAGSWDRYRAETDVSGSLNEAGTVRGRLVAAYDDKNSYLDRYEKNRQSIYGVIDFELSDTSVLTLGHTYQQDKANSPLWGALPVAFSDGSPTRYDRSDSSASDWSFWDNESHNSFVELKSHFSNGWQTTAQLSRIATDAESELFYVYGTPDSSTGLGLFAYPSAYVSETEHYIADAYASGPFAFAGREHELVVGAQWARSDIWQQSNYGQGIGTPLPDLNDWDGDYPKPSFDAAVASGEWRDYQRSVYAASKLNVTDALNLIVGSRFIDYQLDGVSYGVVQDREAQESIPYIGAVYALTDNLNVYASYTEIFQPQQEVDINYKTLDPIEGETYEVGLKMDFNDGQAFASIGLFRTEQDNLAVAAGVIPSTTDTYYVGEEGVTSEGIEIDIQGEVLPGLKLSGGYTYVDIRDADDERTNTYTPREIFKLASVYQLQSAPKWKVGASVNWKDHTYGDLVEQGSYAIWDAMVSYQVSPQLKASLNMHNLFDKEYYTSLYWAGVFGQAYYGAPRNASLTLNYDF